MTYGKDRRFFDLVNELSSGQLFVRQLDENTGPGMIRLDSNENPWPVTTGPGSNARVA